MKRCAWVNLDNPLYVQYHDEEWSVPVVDDRTLFEMLTLEGAQAGLSWETILKKREGYRRLFENFDPATVAKFTSNDIKRLMDDSAIVRNRLKIESTITNAQALLKVQTEFGSFSNYLWKYVDGTPIVNRWENIQMIPSESTLSKQISKDLKKRGFRFVGPTIIYAFMQAVGMVNDHTEDCFRLSH